MTVPTEGILRLYRGWNALEQRLTGDERPIVDFDLVSDRQEDEFRSRQEVLLRLLELESQMTSDTDEGEFLRAKLRASMYFLRASMGEEFGFREYVENTLGITPEIFGEEVIREQKERVDALLKERNPKGLRLGALGDRIRLNREEVLAEANACGDRLIPMLLDVLGFPPLERFRIELREACDYWRGWSTNDEEGFVLLYNVHPMHDWRTGDLEFMTLHEVGSHFVHANALKRGVSSGAMSAAIGLTVTHDPHAFVGEGVGDALSDFIDLPLSPWGRLAKELVYLRDLLNNNAHIWVNEGERPDDLVDYILCNHPFEAEERARLNLRQWRFHPGRRGYQYSYGIGFFHHRRFASRLSLEGRVSYLRWALSCVSTPEQAFRMVDQLTEPHNSAVSG